MTDINGKTPQEGASDEKASAQTPSSAMSDNEPREDTERRETASLDVEESDIHLEDNASEATPGDDSAGSPGLPAWLPRSVVSDAAEDEAESEPEEDEAPVDNHPAPSTDSPAPVTDDDAPAEPLPSESDEKSQVESRADNSGEEPAEADESAESAPTSESPAETDEPHNGDQDDAAPIPTYTAAIQKLTKAMVSGQLAQKLRGRLAKHSQEVDTSDRAESADDANEIFGELGDGVDADVTANGADETTDEDPVEDADIRAEETAESPSETAVESQDIADPDVDEAKTESDNADHIDQSELSAEDSDETLSHDPADTASGTEENDTEFIASPPPVPAEAGADDLPPLQMPQNTAEPGRIKFTRSGLKILNLPAGTQVLSNSLRSARSTFDTLQTGGRVDPTRPTIALFVVGVLGAFILSAGTLMGTFNFDSFSGFEADAPPPVASSPEAIPEEEDEEESGEEAAIHPEIAEVTVVSYNDDGGDHQEWADRMIDNDTGTNWQSRYFATPDLPEDNTIRLIITLKESVPVSEVIFTGAIEGGQVDLRVNNGEEPFGGTPLTSAEMGQTTTLTPGEAVEGNTVTLNFVSLPKDDEGRNRVKITELQVR